MGGGSGRGGGGLPIAQPGGGGEGEWGAVAGPATHPLAIWLFGSRARGTAGPDSDFDLMAVFADDDPVDVDTRHDQLADAVAGAGVGVDVAACRASDFAAFRDAPGSLIRAVRERGRQVYACRAERRRRREGAE